ncbi:LOW QUALITY PROTEIN: hypothetical protein HID58_003946, partial [Brassica napus]
HFCSCQHNNLSPSRSLSFHNRPCRYLRLTPTYSTHNYHNLDVDPNEATLRFYGTENKQRTSQNLENVLKTSTTSTDNHDNNVSSRPVKTTTSTSTLLGVWRESGPMKAAVDEMSPRILKRLQRLLSKSSEERSPKNKTRLHGSNNWAGLLDPLDENLRREIVRYGEFVQASYHAFHSDPEGSPRDIALQMCCQSRFDPTFIGSVDLIIRRMGRREIVIALRGTATLLEWSENFRPNLVSMPEPKPDPSDPTRPKVECGFNSLYTTASHKRRVSPSRWSEKSAGLWISTRGEELSISVTGHSLGAAIALLAAGDIAERVPNAPPVSVFSFGGPRVGNREFADRLRNNPWAYSHVGAELRVDMKMSPYLKPNADVACCHDLEAYLHLVDGFWLRTVRFGQTLKGVLYTGKSLRLNRDSIVDNGDVLPSPSS